MEGPPKFNPEGHNGIMRAALAYPGDRIRVYPKPHTGRSPFDAMVSARREWIPDGAPEGTVPMVSIVVKSGDKKHGIGGGTAIGMISESAINRARREALQDLT